MNELIPGAKPDETSNETVLNTVDATTRARCGSLAAHGLSESQIVDVLLLTLEQVQACKNSEEYKKKYAEIAEAEIQKQIDLADGWDGVEERALAQVLETLEYNRDPKYALIAAQIANKANRRKPSSEQHRVIDNSNPQNNVVILNLSKTYITKVSNEGGSATLDITPRVKDQPRKIADLPSPKIVEELLAPVKTLKTDKVLSELEQAFENSGVFMDDDPA